MTTLPFSIDVFQKTRQTVFDAAAGLTTEQLLAVPTGFANNIAWNIGHIIVIQQAIVYHRSGLPMYCSADFKTRYWANTSPDDWADAPDLAALLDMLLEHPRLLAADYAAGKFDGIVYQERTSGSGIVQSTVEHALSYNNYHEGLHLGAIRAIKEFV